MGYHGEVVETRERDAGGSRAVARQAVTAHVSGVARRLVLERGYEETTVEAVCAAAGVSRSTFFRYFASKDDAVLTDIGDTGDQLLDALRARPLDEPVWTALRNALEPLIGQYDAEPEPGRQLAALVAATPGLAAYQHEKHVRWCAVLRPEVARRIAADPADDTDPRPAAVIGSVLACLDAAVAAWAAAENATSIGSLVDRAMAAARL